jgi:hypothetical protein
MEQGQTKLTYSNVMATIAVFLALGGGAWAATHLKKNSVGTKQIRPNAINGSKVKDNSLTGVDLNKATLGEVPAATHADVASSANPEAFAHVSANGTVDPINSKGVAQANVTFVPVSTYCFSGLPFQPRGGQATIDYSDASFQNAQFDLGDAGGCPVGTQAFVYTEDHGTGGSPSTFYVVFYR